MRQTITACNRCGRVLKDPMSIAAQYGASCLKQVRSGVCTKVDNHSPDAEPKLLMSQESLDVECRRDSYGKRFNIPHAIVHHSPGGMNWGYTGSGPSDFALNVLYFFSQNLEFAYKWHQAFKIKFITPLPKTGAVIPGSVIKAWIGSRRWIAHSQIEMEMEGTCNDAGSDVRLTV